MNKAAVALIEREGTILIARRKRDDPLRGKWEFPGGKIEHGETPEECLKRELIEELGISAEIGELFSVSHYKYSHASVELLFYKVRKFSGNIEQREYRDIQWVRPSGLEMYDFPEANKSAIEKLKKEYPVSNG